MLAVSLTTEIKLAASRGCRGGAGRLRSFWRREWRSRRGEEGKDPVLRPVSGGKSPACASGRRTTKDTPRPTGGVPCSRASGGGGRITGGRGMAAAASPVPGSGGEGVGLGRAPVLRSGAPDAPCRGRAGKGEQTPGPEAPAPPLQPLPPHSLARSFLFRSLSVPVSMVTASGRSLRRRPLCGRPAPSLRRVPAVG